MAEIEKEIIKTRNVLNSLKTYAQKNNIELDKCNFSIKKVSTYIKTSSDEEFKACSKDLLSIYKDKDKILNEHIEFNQVYEIIIKQTKSSLLKLNHTIDFGKYSTNPKIIITPDSSIPYKRYKAKDIFLLLVQEINKIKLKNNILINLYDESMIKTLKAFTKHIYAGKFTKKIKIALFDGIEPEISRESKLLMRFMMKEDDHLITEVEIGEILVEFIKPKYGKNGFNAYGQQIDNKLTNNKNDLQATIDEKSIKIVENDDKKLYKSKVKGFVHFQNNHLLVDNKIKMTKISRVQESLAAEEQNNIEVRVSQKDTNKDSIGEGVELTSETIHVTGHIGAKSILEATNLQVDGATHKSSTQFAKYAKINRHKGILRCHKAEVKLLEGGEIHASDVELEAALGGVIYAKNVTISHIKSNLKIFASNSIHVKLVSGEDNLFKINYADIPILNSKIDYLNNDIDEVKFLIEEAKRNDNKKQLLEFREKVKKLRDEINAIKYSAQDAKITIDKPLKGLNNIIFTINDNEIIYKTQAQQYTPFFLEIDEENITLKPVNISIPTK